MRSNLTPRRFATRLRLVGLKFIQLHKEGGNEVDFDIGACKHLYDGLYEGGECRPWCGTVGCHGAWLAVILPQTAHQPDNFAPFEAGAAALAEFLELVDYDCLGFAQWADENPKLWGSHDGRRMFDVTGFLAFDCEYERACTLETIGRRYLEVAARVRALGECWE